MSGSLRLILKAEYFDQIASGEKLEEFREVKPYWRARLEGKSFDTVTLVKGYAPAADRSRHLVRVWRGYEVKTITHPHFGTAPVEVFAIDVSTPAENDHG